MVKFWLRARRAIVMPNLKPPVITTEQALAYRERIRAALPAGMPLKPLMTLYLTDLTPPGEITRTKANSAVHAIKCYPADAMFDGGLRPHHKRLAQCHKRLARSRSRTAFRWALRV